MININDAFPREEIMQGHNRNRSFTARGWAALCAAVILAASGALAAPALTVLHSFAGGHQ